MLTICFPARVWRLSSQHLHTIRLHFHACETHPNNTEVFSPQTFILRCLPSDHTCKTSSLGKYYMGNTSTTKTGRQCIPWSEVLDERHSDYRFPDDTIRDLSNHCRNPDRKILGPWCYYSTDMDDWEYCDVPLCPGNVSWLCNHMRAFSKLLCYSILWHCLTTHWGRNEMTPICRPLPINYLSRKT